MDLDGKDAPALHFYIQSSSAHLCSLQPEVAGLRSQYKIIFFNLQSNLPKCIKLFNSNLNLTKSEHAGPTTDVEHLQ